MTPLEDIVVMQTMRSAANCVHKFDGTLYDWAEFRYTLDRNERYT